MQRIGDVSVAHCMHTPGAAKKHLLRSSSADNSHLMRYMCKMPASTSRDASAALTQGLRNHSAVDTLDNATVAMTKRLGDASEPQGKRKTMQGCRKRKQGARIENASSAQRGGTPGVGERRGRGGCGTTESNLPRSDRTPRCETRLLREACSGFCAPDAGRHPRSFRARWQPPRLTRDHTPSHRGRSGQGARLRSG